jgi:hypothetical protein
VDGLLLRQSLGKFRAQQPQILNKPLNSSPLRNTRYRDSFFDERFIANSVANTGVNVYPMQPDSLDNPFEFFLRAADCLDL